MLKIRLDASSSVLNLRIEGGTIDDRRRVLWFASGLIESETLTTAVERPEIKIDLGTSVAMEEEPTFNNLLAKQHKENMPTARKDGRPTVGRTPPAGNKKLIEGRLVYTCSYSCPECSHSGRRFIWSSSFFTKCHSCNTKIHVKKAVSGVALDEDKAPVLTDKAGNYYVAHERHLTREELNFNKELLQKWGNNNEGAM